MDGAAYDGFGYADTDHNTLAGDYDIQGDEDVPYGAVVRVLAVVRAAGIGKMGLVTDPLERAPERASRRARPPGC